MEIKFLNFKKISNEGGSLIALEQNKNIPFDIKRVYYIFENEKNVRRGFHAHIGLKQVVIAIQGSCTFLLDDGFEKKEVNLNDRSVGLLIESMVWREMFNFSKDCVLVVLASELYDEKDYIRNYEDFISSIKKVTN